MQTLELNSPQRGPFGHAVQLCLKTAQPVYYRLASEKIFYFGRSDTGHVYCSGKGETTCFRLGDSPKCRVPVDLLCGSFSQRKIVAILSDYE